MGYDVHITRKEDWSDEAPQIALEEWLDLVDAERQRPGENPDQEILRKMWRLAQRLGARVQGDDGEFYDAAGNATPGGAG